MPRVPITLLQWAQKFVMVCPKDGGHIPGSLVRATQWCPRCQRIWKLRQDISERKPKVFWYYLSDTGKPLPKEQQVREQKSYTCPTCHMTSYNLNDIKEKYCGNCHVFQDDQKENVVVVK